MRPKSNPEQRAGQAPLDLVLERLPNGEFAWLRPSTDPPKPKTRCTWSPNWADA